MASFEDAVGDWLKRCDEQWPFSIVEIAREAFDFRIKGEMPDELACLRLLLILCQQVDDDSDMSLETLRLLKAVESAYYLGQKSMQANTPSNT